MKLKIGYKFGLIFMPAVLITAGMIFSAGPDRQDPKPETTQLEALPKEQLTSIVSGTAELTSFSSRELVKVDINEKLFLTAVAKAKTNQTQKVEGVTAGIVTHHDLVSDLIADFFWQIKQNREPKTFIIVGPNHPDIGLAPGISGRIDWQTPFGVLEHDYEILDELESELWLAYDENALRTEHSTKVLTPFIKYYFPEAKIAPIAITTKYGIPESLALAEKLSELAKDPDIMIIASVDFSHYLPSNVTDEKDELTWQLVKNKDYPGIALLNNDHVDSPLSLLIITRVAEILGLNNNKILQHTNSGDYFDTIVESSTSYFTVLFGK